MKLCSHFFPPRYGARPLKRVLARDVLNPLSRLVLEGGVIDGDVVKVRTLGEAQNMKSATDSSLSWIGASDESDKNSLAILRNHVPNVAENDVWDDEDFLMEDGSHSHR